MQARTLNVARLAASTMVFAAAFALPAAAQSEQPEGHMHRVHYHHHHHYRDYDRPLTVSRRMPGEPVMVAPDPFHGPAAIVTGPAAVGATVVAAPFRVANMVFPAQGDPAVNPLVLVGAPIHVAGQIVRLPFYAVGSAFGAPVTIDY